MDDEIDEDAEEELELYQEIDHGTDEEEREKRIKWEERDIPIEFPDRGHDRDYKVPEFDRNYRIEG